MVYYFMTTTVPRAHPGQRKMATHGRPWIIGIYSQNLPQWEGSIRDIYLKKKLSWGFENDICHSSKIDDLELYYSKLLNIDRGPYVYW